MTERCRTTNVPLSNVNVCAFGLDERYLLPIERLDNFPTPLDTKHKLFVYICIPGQLEEALPSLTVSTGARMGAQVRDEKNVFFSNFFIQPRCRARQG